jgi:hypothetical protein
MLMERIPQRVGGTFRPQGRLAVPIRYRFVLTGVVPDTHDIVVEGDTVRMEPAGTGEASGHPPGRRSAPPVVDDS